MSILILLTLIQVSHFICDFVLQTNPYLYRNKGILFHPGGVIHAAIHVLGIIIVFSLWGFPNDWLLLAIANGFIHYLIDYSKVNICTKFGLTPVNSEMYWILLGLDQLLHQLTYLVILIEIIP